jgi:transposase
MTEIIFGVDVAKGWIDVVGPSGRRRVPNAGLAGFAKGLAAQNGKAIFEASGGYESPLRVALGEAGVPAVRVNPRRARAFATSLGRLAKTDQVDAAMLREMGQRLDLPLCPPETKEMRKLKALRLRRRQLVEDRKRETVRLAQCSDAEAQASFRRVLRCLEREILRAEAALAAFIRSTPEFAARAALLRTAPGIGPVSALALLADMPELGALSPKTCAALAGLAPMARDSGLRAGKRRIGGGRKTLRDVLYMAGLSAMRCDPGLRAFADRLRAKGKAPKQIVIAVTRKLLIMLNAMIRENRPCRTSR